MAERFCICIHVHGITLVHTNTESDATTSTNNLPCMDDGAREFDEG